MLGFILVLLSSLFEVKYIKSLSLNKNKYFCFSVVSLSLAFFNIVLFLLLSDNINIDFYNNLRILKDSLFYTVILVEIICFILVLLNYKYNSKNITAINFSFFLSIVLMPFFVYLGNNLGFFSNSLKINYNSFSEIVLFSFVLFILIGVYFYDKVKNNTINNKVIFFIVPFILTFNLYLAINMMQEYSNLFFISILSFCLSINFIIFSFIMKEKERITKENFKTIGSLMLLIIPASPLMSFGLSMLPVELGTIVKRLSQLISGVTFDYIEEYRRK